MWFFPFHAQTVVQLFPSALSTPESKTYIYTLPLSHPRIDNARGRRRHFRFVSIQPPRVVPFSPLSSSARLPYLKDARLLSSLLWSFFSPGKCNSRIPTEEVARALSSRGPIELRTRADKKRSSRARTRRKNRGTVGGRRRQWEIKRALTAINDLFMRRLKRSKSRRRGATLVEKWCGWVARFMFVWIANNLIKSVV